MSVFYDLASLVLVPSGYKAQKVYAQKPLTADGQLTFSRASTATRVNASGLIETVASNVPRLDYTNSTCPKLLLEPQRTNSAAYSNAFDDAYWTKPQASVVSGQSDPSGGSTAFKLVEDTSTNFHWLLKSGIVTTAGVYGLSIFAKPAGRNYIVIGNASSSEYAYFNLSNGTIVSNHPNAVGKIEAAGNGFYRCSVTLLTSTSSAIGFFISTDGSTINHTGDGTSGLFLFGAQVEVGAYATSYIPTTTAAVTRLADECSKTGISSLIGQTEGTLFAEFNYEGVANTATGDRIIAISDGTDQNRIMLLKNPTLGTLWLFVSNGGSIVINQTSITGTSIIGGTHKVAVAYKSGEYAVYFNGASVFTSSAAGVPATSAAFVGSDESGSVTPLCGTISQALLFKTRLTNAQLAELTSL